MLVPQLTFFVFSFVILASALMVVTRRNAVAAAMFLALSLISVAGLYVSLHAEFLFAVQILVYAGGVMVLFLFVIMLVNSDEIVTIRPMVRRWAVPVTLATVTLGIMAWRVGRSSFESTPFGALDPLSLGSNAKAVALVLFTDYLLPFEIISILLLVAMVGAILLARKEI